MKQMRACKPEFNLTETISKALLPELRKMLPGLELFDLTSMEAMGHSNSGRRSGIILRFENRENIDLSTLMYIFESVDKIMSAQGAGHRYTTKDLPFVMGDRSRMIDLSGVIWLDGNRLPLIRFEDTLSDRFTEKISKVYLSAVEKGRFIHVKFELGLRLDMPDSRKSEIQKHLQDTYGIRPGTELCVVCKTDQARIKLTQELFEYYGLKRHKHFDSSGKQLETWENIFHEWMTGVEMVEHIYKRKYPF